MKAIIRALLAVSLALHCAAASAQAQPTAPKVLRYAFYFAETGFDPAQISDLNSRIVTSQIFEAPLTYDYLARPFKLKLSVAAAMPEAADDFRTFTVRIKPGIYFADDPAFKGKRRELVAQDFVYSFKRHFDPRWKSQSLYILEKEKILGMDALREQARKTGKFDYDREVPGLRALDRYTFQFKLAAPSPRFIYTFVDPSIFGAVAREVVEFYGDTIMEHPVGTGPFKLVEWRRSSRIVLERNPAYREDIFDAEPPPDDAQSQKIAQQLAGKRLPIVDRVEVSIIDEHQPRWLAFLANEHDMLIELPSDFSNLAIPKNQLAPNLARRGIQRERALEPGVTVAYFNMEDPVIGGYAPARVALRRAIALAYDIEAEIRVLRRGQAYPAQGPMVPMAFGYDPDFKSEMSEYDLGRAKALLDLYGYVDRDGDGWRDQPDGAPLVLVYHNQPEAISRQRGELWKRCMDALGIRFETPIGKWPEQLKQARAGKLMMWSLGFTSPLPDNEDFLALGYGPDKGEGNFARFEHPAFDALYAKSRLLPDGPERLALMQEAVKYLVAYMPYKFIAHRVLNDLMHPWVSGYKRHPFMREFWKYVDVDPAAQARAAR
jgi:ABC-type transport system substrate-binding protein